jgi:Icc protein
MKTTHHKTRREFLRDAGIGAVTLLGWPHRLSWAIEPVAATGSLKVVYYTDIHARVEWDTPEAMMMAAAAMNAHAPDLVLCGGDLITDGYTSSPAMVAPRWEAYLAMHRAISPAPESALGNHDLVGIEPADGSPPAEDPRAEWREKMGRTKTYRSFNRQGYQFIILDSLQVTDDELKYRGFVDEEQMVWLEAELAALDPATPIVLMTHMPLRTGFFELTQGLGSPVPPNRGVVNHREVLDAFAGRRLLAVLQGHLHVNEMMRVGETTFITGGAVCGKWWRGEWHGTSEGYGVLTLHPDRVDWSYHTYGWQARRPAGV